MTTAPAIQPQEVHAAQAAWGEGVVFIGAASTWEDAHARAIRFVQTQYIVEDNSLLFCPTLAAQAQFRSTLDDSVSYFVGRSTAHPEDGGFALKAWTGVRFENHGIVCRGDLAMAMGNYFFKKADDSELKVEFSFVYQRGQDGQLRIQLHHSALPFSG